MKKISIEAYAKINLHLDVVAREDNGYHRVRTVMQSLSLCDTVSVELDEGGECTVTGSSPTMPVGEGNIAYRAAKLFFESVGSRLGANIEITKRIPMAAGLAGGSADAAGVLVALNILCGRPHSVDSLCALGARLGADVPFCIVGGTKYAHGRGEVLEDFPRMPDCFFVVACGGEGVSTPWGYARLDEEYGGFADGAYSPRPIEALRRAVEEKNIRQIADNTYNIFESVILPEREVARRIKATLLENGALGAMMSGSGPSVFGIFEDKDAANTAAEKLCATGIDAFVCTPVGEMEK